MVKDIIRLSLNLTCSCRLSGSREQLQKSTWARLWVRNGPYLDCVVVSKSYTPVKVHRFLHFQQISLSYINYTSIKLTFEMKTERELAWFFHNSLPESRLTFSQHWARHHGFNNCSIFLFLSQSGFISLKPKFKHPQSNDSYRPFWKLLLPPIILRLLKSN